MPRPADHYTHAQFEPVESDFQGETVRCMHCKNWSGSIKTLSRKKEHLLKCSAYAAWRAAGNGQDLPPPNKYNKRDSSALNDDLYSSPYGDVNYGSQHTPNMMRNKLPDMTRFFDEFWDDSTAQKCMRTRCKYCGAVRAKNSTRQAEHLQQCNDFLNSTEGEQAQAEGILDFSPVAGHPDLNRRDIFRGGAPNTNFQLNRQRARGRASGVQANQTPTEPKPAPSLVNHLLSKNNDALGKSTQQQFLSHAGCGTLSAAALQQWLTQQNHISRALVIFIGNTIGKIRLSDAKNPLTDTNWRTLDLLVSCVNNAKRELEFLRSTGQKYGLQSDGDGPKHATKGVTDLFAASSNSSASLLEAMVVLWSIQHLHCVSWQYAATFITAGPPHPTPYSLPAYMQPTPFEVPNHFGRPQSAENLESANAALREALIPNWTSSGFSKFVDACKAIVDELANSQTTGNGAVELSNCELVFKQVLWLWKQMWPEVTGMGEQDETVDDGDGAEGTGNVNGDPGEENGTNGPIEIPDDDEDDERDEDDPAADSPFGGTGLGAIAAANRAATRV